MKGRVISMMMMMKMMVMMMAVGLTVTLFKISKYVVKKIY